MPTYDLSITLKNPSEDVEERLHDHISEFDGEIQSSTIIVSPNIIDDIETLKTKLEKETTCNMCFKSYVLLKTLLGECINES